MPKSKRSWRVKTRTSGSASCGVNYMAAPWTSSRTSVTTGSRKPRPWCDSSRGSLRPTARVAMTPFSTVRAPCMLGLSNTRAALQALQLREALLRVTSELRWVASDYDLGDAFTKKKAECRLGPFEAVEDWPLECGPSPSPQPESATAPDDRRFELWSMPKGLTS